MRSATAELAAIIISATTSIMGTCGRMRVRHAHANSECRPLYDTVRQMRIAPYAPFLQDRKRTDSTPHAVRRRHCAT